MKEDLLNISVRPNEDTTLITDEKNENTQPKIEVSADVDAIRGYVLGEDASYLEVMGKYNRDKYRSRI